MLRGDKKAEGDLGAGSRALGVGRWELGDGSWALGGEIETNRIASIRNDVK